MKPSAIEILREANPVPGTGRSRSTRRSPLDWLWRGTAVLVAVLVLGAGASWAGSGRDPFDLFLKEMVERGAPESFIHTARRDEAAAPPGTQIGPIIEPDQVHVPSGPVVPKFVNDCWRVVRRGPQAIERDPLCRAVLLKDAGLIEAGVYEDKFIEEKFNQWIKARNDGASEP